MRGEMKAIMTRGSYWEIRKGALAGPAQRKRCYGDNISHHIRRRIAQRSSSPQSSDPRRRRSSLPPPFPPGGSDNEATQVTTGHPEQ